MSFLDPGGSALGLYKGPPNYAGQAKKQERQRQALVNQGTGLIDQQFAGFDQPFYDQRQKTYVDYAMPQLAKQYGQTKQAIGFGLSSRGLAGGSAARQQYSNLNQEMGTQKQAISDVGLGQAQDLRKEVEGQHNLLLDELYNTANPTLSGQRATATAAGFRSPSVYAPLGNMFSNLLNQYYSKQLLESYHPSSFVQPGMGDNLYGNSLPPVTYGGE